MEINLSKKKKWILRIICICVLLQLPVVYFMDKFYYFNDDNIRYTIGTYYKEGVIVNSSSNKEKGFMYLDHRTVDSKCNIIVDCHITKGTCLMACVFFMPLIVLNPNA